MTDSIPRKVASVQELLALPDGTRVISFGYDEWREPGRSKHVGIKRGSAVVLPHGVCPAKLMGYPVTVLDGDA